MLRLNKTIIMIIFAIKWLNNYNDTIMTERRALEPMLWFIISICLFKHLPFGLILCTNLRNPHFLRPSLPDLQIRSLLDSEQERTLILRIELKHLSLNFVYYFTSLVFFVVFGGYVTDKLHSKPIFSFVFGFWFSC